MKLNCLFKMTLGLVLFGLSLGWITSGASLAANRANNRNNSPRQAPVLTPPPAGNNSKTPANGNGSKVDPKQNARLNANNDPKQSTKQVEAKPEPKQNAKPAKNEPTPEPKAINK